VSAPDRRRALAGALGTAVGLAGLAFVARLAIREGETIGALLSDAPPAWPGWLAAAWLAGLLGMAGIGWTWGAILRRLGAPLPAPGVLRGYFVGQLGKYVPGGLWGVVGRGEWARRGGVPRPAAYASTLLSMATAYVAACTLALVFLPAAFRAPDREGAALLAVGVGALAPVGLALLHPRVQRAAAGLAGRLTRRWAQRPVERPIELPELPWSASAGFVARQLPSWLLIAAATLACAVGLGVDADPAAVVLATAVSWVVGFLTLPVPGGIGAREATFVALLGGLGGGGGVAAVALAARLVFVLVDLSGAAFASLWAAAAPAAPSATLDR
jgi:uncharacterized membrane protein YbhN (UPF0104 family)